MNAMPDYLDPARRAAVRGMLVETMHASVAAAPVVRRRRVVRFAAIATASALVLGIGGGIAFGAFQPSAAPHGGTAVAPPAKSDPAASASPAPTPSTSLPAGVDPAGTATPVPTPTVDVPDPTAWKITTEGIGPLTLGGSQKTQSAATESFYTVTVPGYDCPVDFYKPLSASLPELVTQAKTDGTIEFITIGGLGTPPTAESPKTPSGIGLGATKAELLATYPDIELLTTSDGTPSTFGETYGIQDAQGRWLTFELDEGAEVGSIGVSYSAGIPLEFC